MDKATLVQKATAYMGVWNAHGDHLLDELADKDITVSYPHFEQPHRTIYAYRQMLQATYHFFPDIQIQVKEVLADGDKAVVSWEYEGTHTNGELFGVAASGKKVKVQGLSVLEFADGMVAKEYGIVDNLGLMMQLKAV